MFHWRLGVILMAAGCRTGARTGQTDVDRSLSVQWDEDWGHTGPAQQAVSLLSTNYQTFWHSHSEYLPAVRHLLVSSGSVGLELIGAHICLIQISMTWSHKVELTPSLLFIFKHSSRHLLKCEVHNYNLPRSVIHWHLAFPLSVRLYQHHQHSRNTAKYFISNICSLHLP